MTQAEIFGFVMTASWCGVQDYQQRFEEDAVVIATTMGAVPASPIKHDQGIGDEGTTYLFPDGSTINIVTDQDGRGVGLA